MKMVYFVSKVKRRILGYAVLSDKHNGLTLPNKTFFFRISRVGEVSKMTVHKIIITIHTPKKDDYTVFTKRNPYSHFRPLRHPPVRPQNLPTNPQTPLPAQKPNHPRDLLRHAQPPKRIPPCNLPHQLLRLALEKHVRGRRARRHAVDADALAAEVLGEHARHLLDCALGGDVEEVGGGYGRGSC